jgi:hypothetical protein
LGIMTSLLQRSFAQQATLLLVDRPGRAEPSALALRSVCM